MMKSSPEVITCRAAVVMKSGEPIKVEEIRVDAPKSGEVRIKMLYASICHTDILFCNGFPQPLFPKIPGHEGVGRIESVGEDVKDLKEGDIVMPLYLGECGDCENCKSGKTNICHKYPASFNGFMADGTSRMRTTSTSSGEPIYHLFSCSTWSEYTVIDANYVLKVDDLGFSLHHATFLCCGFTTGYGAAWKEAAVHKGSTVAVLGLGAVGLGVVAGARMQGASIIIGVDINDTKRAKGEAFGMTHFINPQPQSEADNPNISDLVRQLTGGLGVDYCFECTGVPSVLNPAIDSTKIGLGKVVLIGVGQETSVQIDFIPLLLGRTLMGTIYGGVRIRSDLPTLINKCINQEIPLDELITHEVPLLHINKAFQLLKEPDCLKVVIKF